MQKSRLTGIFGPRPFALSANRHAGGLFVLALLCLPGAAQAERYTIPWFVPAGAGGAPQGVLRILNGTDETGAVEIYAIGDAGMRSGPASFTLNASAAAEFTSTDLQSGNAMLGLSGGIGAEVGDARLEIVTDLDIVPLAYVRAADGTLSAMHDTVRATADGAGGHRYEVPLLNPASDVVQQSRLRLINPGNAAASITIMGRDDGGAVAAGGTVELTLAAGASRTLTAQQLEAGDTGLAGQLGAAVGRWRLVVSSDQPIQVVNVVTSTSGHTNNLSTTAVAGPAPVDHDAFNERFLGSAIRFRTDSGDFTFAPGAGDTFTVTREIDGATTSRTGRYGYAALGADAGRMTQSYDDALQCEANLYFATPASGWFASFCTDADDPDGYWVGGEWSVMNDPDEGQGGGDPITRTYGVDETLPGVPSSGAFVPSVLYGGSVSATDGGTMIYLDEGGYFELSDGTRYACASSDGCAIANGAVTRGTVTGTAAGTGEVDRFPTFRSAANPGNQSYAAGAAIDPLTLPEASGGNDSLTYSLSPNVPGLTFNASARQLTGTPSTPGTYAMTYTVTDEDGDTDNLGFNITVSDGTTATGSLGDCQVGMSLSSGQSCTYPGTTDEFSVNARGRGSFLGRLAGIRIRIDNETIGGREYHFEASHQGDGVWRIDRIEGRTEPQSVPHFAEGAAPQNQTYTVGTAIDTLTLPAASGGNGTLTYSLAPEVPGLSFDPLTRRLTGTPTAAGDYDLTYSAADADGDVASLAFTLSVAVPVVPVVEVVQDYGDVRTVEATPRGRVHVSVVDLEEFGPGTHGEQITQTFLDNSSCASLDQLWGLRAFLIDGINRLDHINGSGIVRHTLADDSGIFWTATNDSPWYSPGITDSFFFFVQDRPFTFEARATAEWIRDHNVLVITGVENSTGEPTGNGFESTPLYCDDFDPDDPEGFIPLCGAMGDYIAHTGVGLEKTVFAGAIGRFGDAQAAIRADGVFAPNTIYVESPDGTTSHATAVLAAYATNLAHANPTWSASQLRSELFRIARQERVNHAAGGNASGAVVSERREVNVIRPAMAPACPL